jgi:hypothetical protein
MKPSGAMHACMKGFAGRFSCGFVKSGPHHKSLTVKVYGLSGGL